VSLVIPHAVLAELRVALLTDVRSVGEGMLTILDSATRVGVPDLDAREESRRWRELTTQLQTRRELQDIAGWPGQPRAECTLTEPSHSALAVEIPTHHHETFPARLSREYLSDRDRSALNQRALLLDAFRRDTHAEYRGAIEAEDDHTARQGEPCQQ
jgi:hypothetical protein